MRTSRARVAGEARSRRRSSPAQTRRDGRSALWKTTEHRQGCAYCVRVTSPRLPLIALVAAAALASLAGCSPEPAVPPAPPTAPAEPLFATDAEALAAAEAAFEEYLTVSDTVFAEQGENAERLEAVASGTALADDLERAEEFRRENVQIEGNSKVIQTTLQQHIPGPAGEAEVSTYICMDSYSIRVVDATGNEVGNVSRPATVTFEAHFSSLEGGELILSRSEIWTSGPQCEP